MGGLFQRYRDHGKVVTRMAKIAAEDLGAEYKTFCFNLPKDRRGSCPSGRGIW